MCDSIIMMILVAAFAAWFFAIGYYSRNDKPSETSSKIEDLKPEWELKTKNESKMPKYKDPPPPPKGRNMRGN